MFGGQFLQAVYTLASPGIDQNETLKVARSGGADPEGNQPGDLFVSFKVPLHAF